MEEAFVYGYLDCELIFLLIEMKHQFSVVYSLLNIHNIPILFDIKQPFSFLFHFGGSVFGIMQIRISGVLTASYRKTSTVFC